MSLNRSVPAEGLKSRGLLFPLGSPPPPRFATVGLARARGGCSRGAPLLTPGGGRERPWGLEDAAFLAPGGSGFRSRGPQTTTGRKKGLCAAGDQSEQPGLLPPPPPRSYAAFFFFFFLRDQCVVPRGGPERPPRPPSTFTGRTGRPRLCAPSSRGRRAQGSGGLQAAGGRRSARSRLQLSPQAGGRANPQKSQYKLLKIISVLLNIRERIQRSDLYRRVTRGDFF